MPPSKVPHPADWVKELYATPFNSLPQEVKLDVIWMSLKVLLAAEVERLCSKYPVQR